MAIKEISQDLHDTLLNNEHIEQVHFTKEGHHYFNVHEFIDRVPMKDQTGYRDKPTGELYGHLLTEVVEEQRNVRGAIQKELRVRNKRNPKARIVETLTREQALDLAIAEEEEPVFVAQLPQRRKPGRKPNKVQTGEGE